MHFIKKFFFFEKNIGALCSKITETQITNIDYENILGLKNFSKKIIGIKKTKHKKNPKKLRDFAMAYIHMPLWGNFNILNLGEYKFSVESLLQAQMSDTPKYLSLTNKKVRGLQLAQHHQRDFSPINQTNEPKISQNTEYKLRTNQRVNFQTNLWHKLIQRCDS